VVWCTPQDAGWSYEDLSVPVGDEMTRAWFIPAADSRGVVLFSHGNAGTMSDRIDSIEVFRSLGFDVLIYDYGGYGNSTGKPGEQRCYEDIRAMWGLLTEERGVAASRIVLFGRSLGSGPSVDLAAETRPGAVILESAFLSTVAVGKETFPFLPIGLMVRHRFDNKSKIGRVSTPVLVIHSSDDEIIPFHHGRKLYELANEPKSLLKIDGGHNEGYFLSHDRYVAGLSAFLDPLFESTTREAPGDDGE